MAPLRIHHLNCGTMCPIGSRLINGEGGLFAPGRLVCHCLLIETAAGLVLVDTGLGVADCATPRERLGRAFMTTTRPRLSPDETVAGHLLRLGLRTSDVRHVVVTHLDPDHAGGLGDLPLADVHVLRAEQEAALHPTSTVERYRYRQVQWAHGPRWRLHDPAVGESWMGFESVRALGGTGDEVLLIPLGGHTRGHAGVAVRTGDGWLLHCGDAYFFRGELEEPRHCPPVLEVFQKVCAVDDGARLRNQQLLGELSRRPDTNLRLFCAHDPVELDQLQRASVAT